MTFVFAQIAAFWLGASVTAYLGGYYKLSGFLACISSGCASIAVIIAIYSAI